MKLSALLVLVITLVSAVGNAAPITCKTAEGDIPATLVADVVAVGLIEYVELKELHHNETYGSRDRGLFGDVSGDYIRFTPEGGANAIYKFAVPRDYLNRHEFPLFLDSQFEGYNWFERQLTCTWGR